MFHRVSQTLRSPAFRRAATQNGRTVQKRSMGGGGAFMETNKNGERIGEAFGTLAWVWIFHRFRMDGAVLLGMKHPWEHDSHGDHDDGHAIGAGLKPEEAAANWQTFSEKAIKPGDDDDDDDDEDDEEDDDDDEDDDE
eukprot:CAMPEP_0119557552 /NCGR_PEP_ID=MMETSP1352-20130426/9192_1 /TAXON_ID=265584 /ORGANISM="Stauroneis constricta, Strain CCMP1120" /LENGTH=137 /DNA_ID=CAMNT_0007604675 /DNA_START=123 /DNA_END=536 /DNA_ORIENTATION=+